METLKGIGASGGIVAGRIFLMGQALLRPVDRGSETPEQRLERLEQARLRVVKRLERLGVEALDLLGESQAAIFEIHRMLLEDPVFLEPVRRAAAEAEDPAAAVRQAGRQVADQFFAIDDEYLRQRGSDILDICAQWEEELSGVAARSLGEEPVIIAARDLMPSQTLGLDRAKVLAFVTREGSSVSHSAILSRSMGIPALVALGDAFDRLEDGELVIVDGDQGELVRQPDEAAMIRCRQMQKEALAEAQALEQYKSRPAVTLDGFEVEICANISSPEEAGPALASGAMGVGLFRSECLYLGGHIPTEEEQFAAYREVLERMEGRRVVIRTLDLGADKQAEGLILPREKNPAMGFRGVRLCLSRHGLMLAQLRALLRASVWGKLAILIPMVISVDEVLRVKALLGEARRQLERQGIPCAPQVELGVMIETPAAAMISDLLARHVDFFSIGTSDLTQYTMAADRMNRMVAQLCDPGSPAVLTLVRMTVENAAAAGIWAGICGESAADPGLIPTYLAMGMRRLSVVPAKIAAVKKQICQTDRTSLLRNR